MYEKMKYFFFSLIISTYIGKVSILESRCVFFHTCFFCLQNSQMSWGEIYETFQNFKHESVAVKVTAKVG